MNVSWNVSILASASVSLLGSASSIIESQQFNSSNGVLPLVMEPVVPSPSDPWYFLITMPDSASELLQQIVMLCAAVFLIFGGPIPFLFQYDEIRKRKHAKGFSLYVCLTLLVANILRVQFWFGKRFELTLLLQSILMICAMCAMVHLVVVTNRQHLLPPYKPITAFDGHLVSYFWEWTDLSSYVFVLCVFAVVMSFCTSLLINNWWYIEAIGFISLFIEANLGTSQLVRNHMRKSTVGMSIPMVLCWLLGDVGKTGYFVVRASPAQFWICGVLQICIDIVILLQVFCYRNNKAADF